MNKIYLLSIDSTIKTFSVVDGGVGVRYVLDDQFGGIVLNVDDVLLGFVSQGVNEIRSSYRVLAVDDNSVELEKEIERASGVPISMFMPQLSACLSSLLSGVEIADLDQELASKIHDILLGKSMTVPKLPSVGPRQLITYGAPGTGKSFRTKKETTGQKVHRTTFHPDSDYAMFVGAYKPTVKNDGVAFTEVYRKETGSGQFSLVEKRDQKSGISYEFVEQVFTKAYIDAWAFQKQATTGADPKPVYLIIEEINRGNCAQVFGDLFQLLDRNAQGFSEYALKPDTDFGAYIGRRLSGVPGEIDANRKAQINALYPEIEDDINVVDEVFAGRVLILPDNLFIRATMNTSDQSLFPMDSAFKRRWDWDYVAIVDHPEEGWEIEIDATTHYYWWDFLDVINKEIFKATSSEDKQLGYFFVRTPSKKIDLNMFVNKVVFYLWNSVFKDCYTDCEFLKEDKDHYFTFTSFFNKGVIDPERAKKFLGKLKGLQSKEAKEAAKQSATVTTSSEAAAATTDAGGDNA